MPEQALAFSLTLFGALVEYKELALILGLLGITLAFWFSLRSTPRSFSLLLLAFSATTLLTITISRSGFGIDYALASSRYTPFTLTFWATLYVSSLMESPAHWKPKILALALIICPLYFASLVIKHELNGSFAQTRAQKLSGLGAWLNNNPKYLLYPAPEDAREILKTSARLGVYRFTSTQLDIPRELTLQEIAQEPLENYIVDENDENYLKGWALLPNIHAEETQTSILLTNFSKVYKLPSLKVYRPDVSAYFKRNFFYDQSGFEIYLSMFNIPRGEYRIGIMVESKLRTAIHWLDKTYLSQN
jgi:hypothetical protein